MLTVSKVNLIKLLPNILMPRFSNLVKSLAPNDLFDGGFISIIRHKVNVVSVLKNCGDLRVLAEPVAFYKGSQDIVFASRYVRKTIVAKRAGENRSGFAVCSGQPDAHVANTTPVCHRYSPANRY